MDYYDQEPQSSRAPLFIGIGLIIVIIIIIIVYFVVIKGNDEAETGYSIISGTAGTGGAHVETGDTLGGTGDTLGGTGGAIGGTGGAIGGTGGSIQQLPPVETVVLHKFRINLGSEGYWNYIFVDERLLNKINIGGYTPFGGVVKSPGIQTPGSVRVTLYANVAAKTGGYVIGSNVIPPGSVHTGTFYTKSAGTIKRIISVMNGGVAMCPDTGGWEGRACDNEGTTSIFRYTI